MNWLMGEVIIYKIYDIEESVSHVIQEGNEVMARCVHARIKASIYQPLRQGIDGSLSGSVLRHTQECFGL